MKRLLNYLKSKLGITDLECEIHNQKILLIKQRQSIIDTLEAIKSHTRVDADVGYRGNNTIILTGVYNKRAFVQFYDLGNAEFASLVNQLKRMRDYSLIRNIDAPPSFKGIFNL